MATRFLLAICILVVSIYASPAWMDVVVDCIRNECTALELNSQLLSSSDVALLVQAFPQMKNLLQLDLGYNNLTNEGVEILAPHLTDLPHLQLLSLYATHLGDEALEALLKVVPTLPVVTWKMGCFIPYPSFCNTITDKGALALAKALPPRLQFLDLNYNNITMIGAKALVQAALEMPAFQTIDFTKTAISYQECFQLKLQAAHASMTVKC